MENGGDPQENATTPKADTKKDDLTPVYSREVTLQAHFTFGTPSMAPVQYAHVTPTSTSSLSGRPLMASGAEQWRWRGDGSATGAQCSITCGREGLTMTYNAQPANNVQGIPFIPCAVCDSMVAAHTDHLSTITTTTTSTTSSPGTIASLACATCFTSTPSSPTFTRSLMDLSKPQEQPTTRSLTFSGSLDRATQRPVQQRPYGRRCKSTAHIILQNNELQGPKETRPHEFHATLRDGEATHHQPEDERPTTEPRGRARHRGGPDSRFRDVGASGGWERLHSVTEEQEQARHSVFEGVPPPVPPVPPMIPPCCPCHHCTALYSFMSSLAHERTCHACAHHHHHHPSCSPSHSHTPGPAPTHPYSHPGEVRAPLVKSPTTRTFNSHKCYEDEPGGPRRPDQRGTGPPTVGPSQHLVPPPAGSSQRLVPPADRQQAKPRTPSPGVPPRRPPSPESPESSPSPERPGRAFGVDQQPHTTPQLPRRVPRMGAAAAAAGPSSYSAAQVYGYCVRCTSCKARTCCCPSMNPHVSVHVIVC